MKNTLALITIMIWPVIPLMWIPVHLATPFFRRLGRATYMMVAVLWSAAAYLIYINRDSILAHKLNLEFALSEAGMLLLIVGSLLHVWTAALLTFPGIIGVNEIATPQKSKLVEAGPFSVVRHPTYLAHTIMFLGIFLFTGYVSVAVLTVIDFLVVSLIIIPFEERELRLRFGAAYDDYMKRVPSPLPRCCSKTRRH